MRCKMKKAIIWIALLIISAAIFIMPFAAAEETQGAEDTDNRYQLHIEDGIDNVLPDETSGTITGDAAANKGKRQDRINKAREIKQEVRKEAQEARKELQKGRQEIANEAKEIAKKARQLGADFREHQQQMLMNAVEKCRELGLGEKCEEKFNKRIELIKKLAEKDLERLQKIQEKAKERKDQFLALNEKFKNPRNLTLEEKDKLREGFEKAKEKFLESKALHKAAAGTFDEAKKLVNNACKEATAATSEVCKQAKDSALAKAKELVEKSANEIIDNINKVKERIKSTEGLTEEQVNEYAAKLDEKIKAVEGIKAKIATAATKEEVKTLAKQIKEIWKETEFHVRKSINVMAIHRMAGILVQIKQLGLKLDKVLQRIVEQGKDPKVVETLVEQFHTKTEAAKQKFSEAEAMFKEFQTTKNVNVSNQAHEKLKEAQKALVEAREILRNIVQKAKETGAEKELKEEFEEKEEEVDNIENEAEALASSSSGDNTATTAT